jgi:hypothetical protein
MTVSFAGIPGARPNGGLLGDLLNGIGFFKVPRGVSEGFSEHRAVHTSCAILWNGSGNGALSLNIPIPISI